MAAAASAAAPPLPLVQLTDLRVGYRRRAILPPISTTIAAGELWAVIGPNGAGKSTFVQTLLGLQAPVGGRIDRAERLRMSYVPQQSALDTIFPISVGEFVRMGRQAPGRFTGRASHADAEVARAALAEVGAAERTALDLIDGLRRRPDAAVVMVTHLVEETLERADRALLLDRDHEVALAAGADELRASPAFVKIYGRIPAHGRSDGSGAAGAERAR